jgi:pyrroline-5-carboxylate reductase
MWQHCEKLITYWQIRQWMWTGRNMARIGFIGTGEIAECMVRGLAGSSHRIYVSERNAKRADALAATFDEVSVADNQTVLDQSDYICLCLMKDAANAVLPTLNFHPGHKVISAMVDVDLNSLVTLCAPAKDISITIPLPFIATGNCPLPVYPDTGAVGALFGDKNIIVPVASEQALNAHFAASALASAIFAQMKTGSEWLGGVTGDRDAAETYITAMLGGFITSLPSDGQGRLNDALQSLSTEGGLNATLRAHLEDAGVLDTLHQGLDNFKPRLGLAD